MTPTANQLVEIQPRDIDLLRGLFEARVMRPVQIAKLDFAGSKDAAKKRLQKLKAAGLVRERPGRRVAEAATLSLTKRGFDELTNRSALVGYPTIGWKSLERRLDVSEATLKHEGSVIDVKAALAPAIDATAGLSVTEFSVWPLLCSFVVRDRQETRPGKPDGLLRVEQTTDEGALEHVFFLEVDRGQESQSVLVEKANTYKLYQQSGDLAARLGEHGVVPFRVLMIFRSTTRREAPSVERRNNAAEKLAIAGYKTFVWLTTLEELVADPLGKVWTTPKQYMEMTSGTQFEPLERREPAGPYRRQPERERFIEAQLAGKKLALLE
jgi:hypothetical protein